MAEGPQTVESEENDLAGNANEINVPGGLSGRIGQDGDVDHVRFLARQGQRVVIEIYGRRLGSPIDPVIEILDEEGQVVPRAVLRPVAQTAVAFRDHASTGRNIRLTKWEDFAVGDYVLVGRELMRLYELPRNPDDDAIFWGLGNARLNSGERVAFLGTTPEHHPQGQTISKVEIHPPGTHFPSGGASPVTIDYRNDDGGPGYDKDSYLLFDPPHDGPFVVRVMDVRGIGGLSFGYHLIVRPPEPDFRLSLDPENPNIARGGGTVVSATIERIDGFDGPVDVALKNLPPGITATETRIEADTYTADLLLTADESAPAISPPTWSAVATANVAEGSSDGGVLTHEIDPQGPLGGWITVTPEPNLSLDATPRSIVIHPGERVEMSLSVERSAAFQGRVPINMRNLPLGVRVLNIGLNGVLITEDKSERTVFLYAEPWVQPLSRMFFAEGRCEQAGTENCSPPISLEVRPRDAAGHESTNADSGF